ncbi:ester cyclase [Microbacterium paludicola]|uniref:nuclear transport factor 2 family protein n=1 Tax=Microbacterium paludicola TaxID=300019 RepID=UPI0038796FA9
MQEPRLDPRAHAPYDRVEDYILEWTDRIWADAAIGAIPRMYSSDVIVRSATGVSVGVEPVVRGSLAKKAAFVDRIGVGEDVVWEPRGPSSFVSHHRVLHSGGQQGPWSYGPPLGRAAVSRNLPVCLVEDGLVSEEWVVRDEWAVVEGLGHDPAGIAVAAPADLAPLGDDGLFGRPAPDDPTRRGDSGERPAAHLAEATFAVGLWRDLIDRRRFDLVPDFYARDAILHTSRNRTVTRREGIRADLLAFLAPFPDARVEVRDVAAHASPHRGLRISVLWRLVGTYSGMPLYGAPGGEPVEIMGVSQYELERGRIRREYRIYDELAILAQIEAGRARG